MKITMRRIAKSKYRELVDGETVVAKAWNHKGDVHLKVNGSATIVLPGTNVDKVTAKQWSTAILSAKPTKAKAKAAPKGKAKAKTVQPKAAAKVVKFRPRRKPETREHFLITSGGLTVAA